MCTTYSIPYSLWPNHSIHLGVVSLLELGSVHCIHPRIKLFETTWVHLIPDITVSKLSAVHIAEFLPIPSAQWNISLTTSRLLCHFVKKASSWRSLHLGELKDHVTLPAHGVLPSASFALHGCESYCWCRRSYGRLSFKEVLCAHTCRNRLESLKKS